MREIEVLVRIFDDIRFVLDKMKSFESQGVKHVIDTYYFDPLRENLKPSADLSLKIV